MSTAAASQQWVWLARIRRPQGRKGEVFADILTDFPEKFAERKRLWLLPDSQSRAPSLSQSHRDKGEITSQRRQGGTAIPPQAGPDNTGSGPSEVQLLHHWLHKGGIVLHFAGIDSISAAETLTGLIVAIPLTERAPLAEDEIYIGDLIGCTLIDVAADPPIMVGEIENVDRCAGPAPLLIVAGAQGEVLVPFAKSYLRKIDLENRRVEMALPEGLIDLNR